MRNCSLLKEKRFPLVLSSGESILFRNDQSDFHSEEEFYLTFSREASKERILSIKMKGSFYFKMTAQNQRTMRNGGTFNCLYSGYILKNDSFDNDSSYSELEQIIR